MSSVGGRRPLMGISVSFPINAPPVRADPTKRTLVHLFPWRENSRFITRSSGVQRRECRLRFGQNRTSSSLLVDTRPSTCSLSRTLLSATNTDMSSHVAKLGIVGLFALAGCATLAGCAALEDETAS